MILYNQIIHGEPKTKKNSQNIFINKKTGKRFITQSEAYQQYEMSCGLQLEKIPEPISVPVNVKCIFYRSTNRVVDLPNLLNAMDDILVKYGIIKDDNFRIVRTHNGSTVYVDKEHPRVEITIEETKV